MQKAQKMKEILPLTNGLFSHMNYTFRAEVTKGNLDLQFLANYGQRNPSPIVEMIQGTRGSKLTDAELTTLAGVILEMYKEKWDKLGDIYDIEYDPIHNYLDDWEDTSDEDRSGSSSGQGLENTTFGHTVTDSVMRSDATHETRLVTEDNTRTRTDDLTKTERRNLSNTETRTDNLQEEVTYGKTDTRTDNLLETDSFGKTETRTDNLTETTTYGKIDTRTDNLKEELTHGKTDTRTDNLTEQTTYGKTDTRTDDLKHEIKGTETTTPNTTEGTDVYAFNSSTGLSTQDVHNTGTTTLSFSNRENDDSGTVTDVLSGSDTTTRTGTQTNALSGKDTKDNTGTLRNALSGSDATANTGTQATAASGSDTVANTGTQQNVAGGKDTTKDTGTRTTVNENTGTITTEDDGTETTVDDKSQSLAGDTTYTRNISDVTGHTGMDSVSSTKSGSETLAIDRERSGRHFGNIGNLTSQKQILEEINLWKWNYVKDILSDVKEFCTLPVYLNATEWQLVD